mgnify:CR=1 FL=1
MKVLFLDIDGVVNKQENFNPTAKRTMYPLDSYCAFLVGKIQLDTGCEVVLSSMWRLHPDGVAEVNKSVVKLLDKTPSIYRKLETPIFQRGRQWDYSLRGDEVNAWLERHPEVTRYAILDDDRDFYDSQPLFQTTFEHGLTDEIAKQVTDYLNAEEV